MLTSDYIKTNLILKLNEVFCEVPDFKLVKPPKSDEFFAVRCVENKAVEPRNYSNDNFSQCTKTTKANYE